MTTSLAPGTTLVDVLSGDPAQGATVGGGGALTVQLPPRGARILVPQADVVQLP
jgi:hypothetical protein